MDTPPPATTTEPALLSKADTATIARLRRKARRVRRLTIGFLGVRAIGYGLISYIILMALHTGLPHSLALLSVLFPCILLVSVFRSALKRERRDAIMYLRQSNEAEVVPVLIEALHDNLDRDFVQSALRALLPGLKASDAPLITPRHHRILNATLDGDLPLQSSSCTDFCVAILKAYEQVGNANDVQIVAWLAEGKGYAKRNTRILEAAWECLPYLQARSEQQTARQTLLRASSANAESGESLLRPAQSGSDTEPRQLLRPASRETET